MALRTAEDIKADRQAVIERLMPNLKKQKPNGTTHMRWDDLATLCGLDIVALQQEAGVIHVESVAEAEASAEERLAAAQARLDEARRLEAEADELDGKRIGIGGMSGTAADKAIAEKIKSAPPKQPVEKRPTADTEEQQLD